MSAVVNLTELAAARARMTPGKYETAEVSPESDDGALLIVAVEHQAVRSSTRRKLHQNRLIATMEDDYEQEDDGPGLVATHNAADVLIEVARTAKALESAQAQWREQGAAAVHVLDAARAAHQTALDKVSL